LWKENRPCLVTVFFTGATEPNFHVEALFSFCSLFQNAFQSLGVLDNALWKHPFVSARW